MDDYSHDPSGGGQEPDFSWITFIYEFVDVLGEECRSPEETLECFAYVLETFYPNFRMTVYYIDDETDSTKSHLILQKGYPVPMDEFERMIDENSAFIRPYAIARKAMFLDDYGQTKSLMGNVFDEGCAAHIPIVSRRGLHGWFTLSAIDKDYRWSDKERKWLPVAGHLCGSYVELMKLIQKTRAAEYQQAKGDMARLLIDVLEGSAHADFSQEARSQEASPAFETPSPAREKSDLLGRLTNREREILGMVSRGMSNVEISQELYISKHTVRKHLENVFAKLNVNNRTQAALLGEQMGD